MSEALPAAVQAWRERGEMLRVGEHELFVLEQGKGPAVVLLHGFPTSSYDWHPVLDALSARHRVLTLDLPGYGLSSKPALYSYSLLEQADALLGALAAKGVEEAHLVAHDMGTTVACELLARREQGALPLKLRSLTLMNGSVHIEMAKLTPSQHMLRRPLLGQLFVRLSSRPVFKLQFRRLFGQPDAVSDAELDNLWALLRYRDGHLRLPRTVRYIEERYARMDRWIPPLGRLDVPSLVLWGQRDPVAVYAIAERLARELPGSRLRSFAQLGHYPQLEDPVAVRDALLDFLLSVERQP